MATLAVVGATAPDETLTERDNGGMETASGESGTLGPHHLSAVSENVPNGTGDNARPRSVSVASSGRAEAAPLTTPASPTVSGTARPDTGIQSHLRFTVPLVGLSLVLFFAWGRLQVWPRVSVREGRRL